MRQSNGTVVVYPIRDMVHGRMFQVSIKGLDGKSKHHGQHRDIMETNKVAKQWASFTGFPVALMELRPQGYWLGVGVGHPKGRGQFDIVARSYAEAQEIANTAGLGNYPIQSFPFNSLPVHGTIEA